MSNAANLFDQWKAGETGIFSERGVQMFVRVINVARVESGEGTKGTQLTLQRIDLPSRSIFDVWAADGGSDMKGWDLFKRGLDSAPMWNRYMGD